MVPIAQRHSTLINKVLAHDLNENAIEFIASYKYYKSQYATYLQGRPKDIFVS